MPLNLTVIGCGYLGATHAAAMAHLGFDVIGVDTDPAKVATLSSGRAPFHEPALDDLLAKYTATGRLRFTTSYAEAAEFGDVHFLCTGTPQESDSYACDMSQVHAAVDTLAPHLNRPCLVIGKSTVPVGSAETLAHRLNLLAPAQVELAWNPEFLREGFAVQDTLHPDRIVAGVTSDYAEKVLREVYAGQISDGSLFLPCDLPTAELVKVAANSFLAMKISFINAMAEVCEETGADVVTLAEALGHDERIGRKFLQAGVGYGGGCLPKDLRAFLSRTRDLGLGDVLALLYEADVINSRARRRVLEMTRDALGGTFAGKRVAVLGATFKPDTDDVRDSPALDVAARLHRRGAQVVVCDPHGIHNAARAFPEMEYTEDPLNAVRGAEAVLHLTEWSDFAKLDVVELGAVAKQCHLIDGRNTLDPEPWRVAGWTVRAMGRPRL